MIRKSFGRSLSFPTPPAIPKLKGRGSTSLPTRFHPFLSTLSGHTHHLLTWQQHSHTQTRPDPLSSDRILDGLSRIDRLHYALDDLLQHPRVHYLLRRRSPWTGWLLEDFLRFADVYSSFRSAIFTLKDRHSETRTAIRRNDDEKIALCLKNQRRAEKELIKISSAARNAGRWGPVYEDDVEELELAVVVREAVGVTAAATSAVFAAVAEMSAWAAGSTGVTPSITGSCIVGSMMCRLKKKEMKGREEGDLEELDEFIGEVERRSERLLRSFVNTRVFLLNVLTPCS